jgi:hypothetical protein
VDHGSRADFREACIERARALSRANGELTLLMSGGLQSEWLARVFEMAEIPFRIRIFNISGNLFDIDRAIRFCKKRELSHEVTDLDLRDFSRLDILANQHRARYSEVLVALRMCELTPGFPVRAAGLPLHPSLLSNDERLAEETRVAGQLEAKADFAFFSSSAVSGAYLEHPLSREWERLAPVMGFTDRKEWREIIFRSYCDEIEPRISWTGLEHIQNLVKRL